MAEELSAWIGNTESSEDLITEWPARALLATLDRNGPALAVGDALPPMWHWLYFLQTVRGSELGGEGHARLGEFLPPVPLPRRMFAGGRTEFLLPIHIGERAERTGTVVSIVEKSGRSGPLVFVTVRHEVETEAGIALIEEQDLVYREAATSTETPGHATEPIPEAAWRETITPDTVMLFRFSALTFNSHRIHYDQPYVTEVERYPDLVVHGPLIAMLLADLACRSGSQALGSFSFRARSPLFVGSPFLIQGSMESPASAQLAALSPDGRLAMTAEAGYLPHPDAADQGDDQTVFPNP